VKNQEIFDWSTTLNSGKKDNNLWKESQVREDDAGGKFQNAQGKRKGRKIEKKGRTKRKGVCTESFIMHSTLKGGDKTHVGI